MPITAAHPHGAVADVSSAGCTDRRPHRCASMVFRDDVAAPEDVSWWLRDELDGFDVAWVTQVEIAAGGLVAAATRLHTVGVVIVHVTEHPLEALIEVAPCGGTGDPTRDPTGDRTGVSWAVVH